MGKQCLADIFADIDSQGMASGRKPQQSLLRSAASGVSGQSSQCWLTTETFGYSVRVVFAIQDTSVLPILLRRADGYDDGVPQLFSFGSLLVVASMHLLPSGMIPVI